MGIIHDSITLVCANTIHIMCKAGKNAPLSKAIIIRN